MGVSEDDLGSGLANERLELRFLSRPARLGAGRPTVRGSGVAVLRIGELLSNSLEGCEVAKELAVVTRWDRGSGVRAGDGVLRWGKPPPQQRHRWTERRRSSAHRWCRRRSRGSTSKIGSSDIIENRFVGLRFAGKRKKKSRGASYQTKQQHQTKQHHRVSLSRRLGPPVRSRPRFGTNVP